MNDADLIELQKKKARLIAGMTDYMHSGGDDFNPGYTEDDIQKCDMILRDFIDDLQKLAPAPIGAEILNCAKAAVLKLNKLNKDVGGGLIETDQREDLCDYIQFAAEKSGLKTEGDITEEWREW